MNLIQSLLIAKKMVSKTGSARMALDFLHVWGPLASSQPE